MSNSPPTRALEPYLSRKDDEVQIFASNTDMQKSRPEAHDEVGTYRLTKESV